jgi:hypothetical protein
MFEAHGESLARGPRQLRPPRRAGPVNGVVAAVVVVVVVIIISIIAHSFLLLPAATHPRHRLLPLLPLPPVDCVVPLRQPLVRGHHFLQRSPQRDLRRQPNPRDWRRPRRQTTAYCGCGHLLLLVPPAVAVVMVVAVEALQRVVPIGGHDELEGLADDVHHFELPRREALQPRQPRGRFIRAASSSSRDSALHGDEGAVASRREVHASVGDGV